MSVFTTRENNVSNNLKFIYTEVIHLELPAKSLFSYTGHEQGTQPHETEEFEMQLPAPKRALMMAEWQMLKEE